MTEVHPLPVPRFRPGQVLLHKKTQRRYRVLIAADLCRLEDDAAPAYAYCLDGAGANDASPDPRPDPRIWVRRASEMEDGRFEPVDPA